jgi:uncharacterized SAM-binding protein YcdF (DUF218 family)
MSFIVSKLIEHLLVPSNVVLIVGLGGVAMLILRWRRLGLAFCVVSILSLFVGGVTPLGAIALATLEDRFPMPALALPPTGIIVLGGATDIHISSSRHVVALNDAAERVTAAAALAIRFPQARIFLSGGAGHSTNQGLKTESALARALLLGFAIPPDRILMEEKSLTTWENAKVSFETLDPKPGDIWLLVTSANHMPRAVGSFRAAGFNIVPFPVDFRTKGDAGDWSRPKSVADGFEQLDLAGHEWIGLAAYRLAGKSSTFFPAP